MATVAHKNLTGTDLHEPKGAAAAAVDKVYVSDGAGSGTWKKLDNNQLTGAGNPFGGQLFHVQDQKTIGTDGGTFNSSAWRTRTLNTTLTNEIASASLASNQITLPAGTYFLDAIAPVGVSGAAGVNFHRAKLYNVTDGTDVLFSANAHGQNTCASHVVVRGRFTIAGTKVFELRHYCTNTVATFGFGTASGLATETYADVMIWKVA